MCMACRAVPRAPRGLQLGQLHLLRGAGNCAANQADAAAEDPPQPMSGGSTRTRTGSADLRTSWAT